MPLLSSMIPINNKTSDQVTWHVGDCSNTCAPQALKLAMQAGAGPDLRSSARRLDRLSLDMAEMIQRWPLHLKALVESFSSDLRSQSNVHFQRLYLLLPAVSHNYVEVMLLCKERLLRCDPPSAYFQSCSASQCFTVLHSTLNHAFQKLEHKCWMYDGLR